MTDKQLQRLLRIWQKRLRLQDWDINVTQVPLGTWLDKHNPAVGGYYVVYKDGYESFSPAQAFEEGYARI